MHIVDVSPSFRFYPGLQPLGLSSQLAPCAPSSLEVEARKQALLSAIDQGDTDAVERSYLLCKDAFTNEFLYTYCIKGKKPQCLERLILIGLPIDALFVKLLIKKGLNELLELTLQKNNLIDSFVSDL